MSSAFKKGPRTPLASSSSSATATRPQKPSIHHTLRPSPFPQQLPLPLFSLGLHAINDVLTGVGLPSGSIAVNLPLDDGDHDAVRLEAAQAYADLVTRYAAAQGIAAGQNVLIVAEGAEQWAENLMGWTGQAVQNTSGPQTPKNSSSSSSSSSSSNSSIGSTGSTAPTLLPPATSEDEKLKVAFRYEKLKKIQGFASDDLQSGSNDSTGAVPFVHPFDLSTKISPQLLQQARDQGTLVIDEVEEDLEGDLAGTDGTQSQLRRSYEAVWHTVSSTIERWRKQAEEGHRLWAQDSSPTKQAVPPSAPPCRIILPSLGSPAYAASSPKSHPEDIEAYRLLLRIKSLARGSSWPADAKHREQQDSNGVEMPVISVVAPSTSLLLAHPHLSTRLAMLADGALAFGSFAADPRLRALFGGADESRESSGSTSASSASSSSKGNAFTGPLRVLKTPAIGSLKPPSIRASQLRGMSSSQSGASGAGSENALGFKVRRKGFKVDVMGRDLVAGGENEGSSSSSSSSSSSTTAATTAPPQTPTSQGSAAQPPPGSQTAKSLAMVQVESDDGSKPPSPPTSASHPSEEASQLGREQQQSTKSAQPARTPLKGLAALRARGLQAQQSSSSSPAHHEHRHQHDREWEKRQALSEAAKQDW